MAGKLFLGKEEMKGEKKINDISSLFPDGSIFLP